MTAAVEKKPDEVPPSSADAEEEVDDVGRTVRPKHKVPAVSDQYHLVRNGADLIGCCCTVQARARRRRKRKRPRRRRWSRQSRLPSVSPSFSPTGTTPRASSRTTKTSTCIPLLFSHTQCLI